MSISGRSNTLGAIMHLHDRVFGCKTHECISVQIQLGLWRMRQDRVTGCAVRHALEFFFQWFDIQSCIRRFFLIRFNARKRTPTVWAGVVNILLTSQMVQPKRQATLTYSVTKTSYMNLSVGMFSSKSVVTLKAQHMIFHSFWIYYVTLYIFHTSRRFNTSTHFVT